VGNTVTIHYLNQTVCCNSGETVLDALLRQGQKLSFSCRNGICHTCLLQCSAGSPGAEAQKSLSPDLVTKGYFLPCKCRPADDLHIAPAQLEDLYTQAVVHSKQWLCDSVMKLLLQPQSNLMYQGGQFLNILHPGGCVRSYSIAGNFLEDPYLELHIKHHPQGTLSHWLCNSVKVGDTLSIQGPQGRCCYHKRLRPKNLLLIANGTGLAPLQGIIRDALAEGHRGNIYLYHGSRQASGLYHRDYFKQLQQEHSNLFYQACVSGNNTSAPELHQGRADSTAFANHPDLTDWAVFICGLPVMVSNAAVTAARLGAAQDDIFSEGFD